MAPLLGLLLAAVLALVASLPALAARPELLALVVVLALVGGPLSLLYLWPLLSDPDQRRGLGLPALSPVGVGLAAVGGLAAHAVAFVLLDYGPLVVFAVGIGLGAPLASTLGRAGRVDTETLTLTIEHPGELLGAVTVDLTDWTALRTVRLGPVVVLWPSLARGGTTPRPLVIPAGVADAAAETFARGVAAPVEGPTRDPNSAVAAVLALFGLGTVALAGVLWRVGALPPGIRLWLLAVCGTFGGLFLFLAWREHR